MEKIQEIFSNREISLIVWCTLFLLFFILKGVGNSLIGLIKFFFASQLSVIYLLMALYTIGIIFILYNINLWNKNFIKDSLIWFLTFAFANLFKAINKKTFSEFLGTINEIFKLTLFVEFIINFKSFVLGVELIMLPLISFMDIAQFLSKRDNNKNAESLFAKTLSIIGLFYLAISLYKTIKDYEVFFSVENLNSLILPAILSFLSLPFFYLLPVYSEYEQLFMRVKFMSSDKKVQRKIKWQIFKTAKLNLNIISNLRDKLITFDLYETNDIKIHLKKIKETCR